MKRQIRRKYVHYTHVFSVGGHNIDMKLLEHNGCLADIRGKETWFIEY